MSDEKCPKCGEGAAFRVGKNWWEYKCLSVDRDGQFMQSPECRVRQLEHVAALLLAACRGADKAAVVLRTVLAKAGLAGGVEAAVGIHVQLKEAIAAAEAAGIGENL